MSSEKALRIVLQEMLTMRPWDEFVDEKHCDRCRVIAKAHAALAASEPRQAGETSAPHNCEKLLESEYPSHDQAADGEIWVCGCGKKYVHVCDEAEGCSWTLAEPATPKPREGGAAMLTDTNSPVIKPQSGDTPSGLAETSVPNCPQCGLHCFKHDNSKCPYRFAPTVCEWIKLPSDLAALEPGSKQERGAIGNRVLADPPLAKAGEFDARCRANNIVLAFVGDGSSESNVKLADAITMRLKDTYAAGRAASGAQWLEQAIDHIHCEVSIGGISPECCALCKAVSEAAPAPAQLSEEQVRGRALEDACEQLERDCGAAIDALSDNLPELAVKKEARSRLGLWKSNIRALLRRQPVGAEGEK